MRSGAQALLPAGGERPVNGVGLPQSQFAHDAETHAAAARIGGRRLTEGRTILIRRAAPGAAADHARGAARIHPGAAVVRRARVVVVPAILDPFGYVAVDVVEAEGIGGEAHHR